MTTQTRRIPGTTTEIKADFAQASCPIYVRYDSDMEWETTPFQVADAKHNPREAVRLVKNWSR